jgi:HAD superfamily phosphatase (TIGR01668 family)
LTQQLLFALRMGWTYRKRLKEFQSNASLRGASVLSLNLSELKANGIKALALDFDGVLAPYGAETLTPAIKQWIHECLAVWGENNIYILSNRPTVSRKMYFSTHFNGIRFIDQVRKKPYPDGINQILTTNHLPPASLLVVDDRLLTGILAAILAGTNARWVSQPLISFKLNPIPELFFILLRSLERFLFRQWLP